MVEMDVAYWKAKADRYRWISVNDRLPESNTEVLVYSKRRGVTIDFVDAFMLTGTVTFYRNSDVTHWTPLPEPPKE